MIDRICKNCEFWDAGGEVAARTAADSDCLNRLSPRFQTTPAFSCDQWSPNTGRGPEVSGNDVADRIESESEMLDWHQKTCELQNKLVLVNQDLRKAVRILAAHFDDGESSDTEKAMSILRRLITELP